MRRRVSGLTGIPRKRSDAAVPLVRSVRPASTLAIPPLMPVSNLSALEVDARIDERINHIADDVQDQPEQREYEQRAEDHGIVAIDDRLEAEQTQAFEREDNLDQHRAVEQNTAESNRKDRHATPHSMAEQ